MKYERDLEGKPVAKVVYLLSFLELKALRSLPNAPCQMKQAKSCFINPTRKAELSTDIRTLTNYQLLAPKCEHLVRLSIHTALQKTKTNPQIVVG